MQIPLVSSGDTGESKTLHHQQVVNPTVNCEPVKRSLLSQFTDLRDKWLKSLIETVKEEGSKVKEERRQSQMGN